MKRGVAVRLKRAIAKERAWERDQERRPLNLRDEQHFRKHDVAARWLAWAERHRPQ